MEVVQGWDEKPHILHKDSFNYVYLYGLMSKIINVSIEASFDLLIIHIKGCSNHKTSANTS